jgi:hypothetical protein
VEGAAELLFTENDTNKQRLWGVPTRRPTSRTASTTTSSATPRRRQSRATSAPRLPRTTRFAGARRDGHRAPAPVRRRADARSLRQGLRRADRRAPAGRRRVLRALRQAGRLRRQRKLVLRQAFAGLLWSKQFYHLDVKRWLQGDPTEPTPPASRLQGRNREWLHLYNEDVISMPDKWEYPWYAAWDLAFHCIPLAMIDPEFAKSQLILFLREWYMHPNGQIPAYEWAFGDVNPPVHAWAVWRVYKIDRRVTGVPDRLFLERAFQKLLLNFTWWVNRKDSRATTSSRAASSAWTTSACSTARRRCRAAGASSSPTAPRGWPCTA